VVRILFIVSEPQVSPCFPSSIPDNLDYSIIVLFTAIFHSGPLALCSASIKALATYRFHSSSETSMQSKNSCELGPFPPSQVWRRKAGLVVKSGTFGSCELGGNRRIILKSIEFSEAGFHFKLELSALISKLRERFGNVHLLVCSNHVV
jgi:hypothetical protein